MPRRPAPRKGVEDDGVFVAGDLQNALDQTEGEGMGGAADWQGLLRDRLTKLEVAALAEDVLPFLERRQEASLLTHEALSGLLQD